MFCIVHRIFVKGKIMKALFWKHWCVFYLFKAMLLVAFHCSFHQKNSIFWIEQHKYHSAWKEGSGFPFVTSRTKSVANVLVQRFNQLFFSKLWRKIFSPKLRYNIRVWSTHSQLSFKPRFLFRSCCSTEVAWLDVDYLFLLVFPDLFCIRRDVERVGVSGKHPEALGVTVLPLLIC